MLMFIKKMTPRFKGKLFLWLFCLTPFFVQPADAQLIKDYPNVPWDFVANEGNFNIFKRKVPGSDFVQFKGGGTIKAPIINIMAHLSEVKKHTNWISRLIEVREVKRIDDQNRIVYYASSSPWPLKDRDFIIRVRVSVDEKKKWIHLRSQETVVPSMPPRDDRVRIDMIRIRWSFHPTNDGKHTYLEFQTHSNPGGIIPSWAMNFYGRYMALKTLNNLNDYIVKNPPNPAFVEKYKKYVDWK